MGFQRIQCRFALAGCLLTFAAGSSAQTQGQRLVGDPTSTLDLADLTAGLDPLTRVSGFNGGLGVLGVPVAGGFDCDGDGFNDFAVGFFLSSPMGRFFAGEVNLVFGDGTIGTAIDTANNSSQFLRVFGEGLLGVFEGLGSEIWMGDVTGDGLGDLLICRQNYAFNGVNATPRFGAGSLTLIVGGPNLRSLANLSSPIDLAFQTAGVSIVTFVGNFDDARLGMWARTGDVDGDGIQDIIVASDQETSGTEAHAGALYVIRGGSHLDTTADVDLAQFGRTQLAGQIARITPPAGSSEFHFGSTCNAGDLDGNGKAEVIASSALNRAGAILDDGDFNAHATAGPGTGRTFVVWDDNFPPTPWPAGLHIDLESPPGSLTTISGGPQNGTFGEELLAGSDFNADGHLDLFVGDLTGDGTSDQSRPVSGVGYVFWRAEMLKGLNFSVNQPPFPHRITKILGPSIGAIGSDTVAQGDFDGDGIDDLVVGNPTDSPLGRIEAGTVSILYGQKGKPWPRLIDTQRGNLPPASSLRTAEIIGALGATATGTGDTLCYSAAGGDIDHDGVMDLITNEMRGDGVLPSAEDSGNLIVLGGTTFSPPAHPPGDQGASRRAQRPSPGSKQAAPGELR